MCVNKSGPWFLTEVSQASHTAQRKDVGFCVILYISFDIAPGLESFAVSSLPVKLYHSLFY